MKISSKKHYIYSLGTYTNITALVSAAGMISRRARHYIPCHAGTITAKLVYEF
jgi:hypothetical protein